MTAETPYDKPSKTERKKSMHKLQDLGELLMGLNAGQWQQLELPENLQMALNEAQGISKHGAKRRQLQYIGKLMRQLDADILQEKLAALLQLRLKVKGQ